MSPTDAKEFDVVIVGAGVLGVSLAYWISSAYRCSVALVEREGGAARHASSRNTGVIHRPFYLDPEKKRTFAISAGTSYGLWKNFAASRGLPWNEVGTLDLALDERGMATVEKYQRWSARNGIADGETTVLGSREASMLEPEVRCLGALHSRTDVSVDFGAMTRALLGEALSRGVSFLGGRRAVSVAEGSSGVTVRLEGEGGVESLRPKLLVNASGSGSLDLAHQSGVGMQFSLLNFRGEYWYVDEPMASRVRRNIYTIPAYPEFPFLDPHFVVRADGSRQVGPNAVPVFGPYAYEGLGLSALPKFLGPPVGPKLRLLSNRTFISMAAAEWRSSLSKRAMCSRVRAFIPALRPEMLSVRGVAGIRNSVVRSDGFVPEALLLFAESSAHVVNYNSPGATGAPAYSAHVIAQLEARGYMEGFARETAPHGIPGWSLEEVQAVFG